MCCQLLYGPPKKKNTDSSYILFLFLVFVEYKTRTKITKITITKQILNWDDWGNIEKHVWNRDTGGLAWNLEVKQRAMSKGPISFELVPSFSSAFH